MVNIFYSSYELNERILIIVLDEADKKSKP